MYCMIWYVSRMCWVEHQVYNIRNPDYLPNTRYHKYILWDTRVWPNQQSYVPKYPLVNSCTTHTTPLIPFGCIRVPCLEHNRRERLSVFSKTGSQKLAPFFFNRGWHHCHLHSTQWCFVPKFTPPSATSVTHSSAFFCFFFAGFPPNFVLSQGGARFLNRGAEDRKAGAPREAEEEKGLRRAAAACFCGGSRLASFGHVSGLQMMGT